jgi:hypothetical protein
VTQVVWSLFCKHKALRSNPSLTKKKKVLEQNKVELLNFVGSPYYLIHHRILFLILWTMYIKFNILVKFFYFYVRFWLNCFATKNMHFILKQRTHTHTHIYIYIYMCICISFFVRFSVSYIVPRFLFLMS